MRISLTSKSKSVGKTALALMLANLYYNVTGKQSVYLRDKSIQEVIDLEKISDERDILKNVNIFSELIKSEEISGDELDDYAYYANNAKTQIYDIFSEILLNRDSVDNLKKILPHFKNDSVFLDLDLEYNKEIQDTLFEDIDVNLVVVTPRKKECEEVKKYLSELTEEEKVKTKVVCNKWNKNVTKQSHVAKALGLKSTDILFVPYSVGIQQSMFKGTLDLWSSQVLKGEYDSLDLRTSLVNILKKLFSTKRGSLVLEAKEWLE